MKPNAPTVISTLQQRHLRIGWLGLLVFLSLGIALEALHALKLPLYLDDRNTTRRLMWTLAHAHGTLFALIHIGFAASVTALPAAVSLRWISRGLLIALIFLPLGFFLGGLGVRGGDPSIGIFLVPIGALALLASVFGFVRRLFSSTSEPPSGKPRKTAD